MCTERRPTLHNLNYRRSSKTSSCICLDSRLSDHAPVPPGTATDGTALSTGLLIRVLRRRWSAQISCIGCTIPR